LGINGIKGFFLAGLGFETRQKFPNGFLKPWEPLKPFLEKWTPKNPFKEIGFPPKIRANGKSIKKAS